MCVHTMFIHNYVHRAHSEETFLEGHPRKILLWGSWCGEGHARSGLESMHFTNLHVHVYTI